MIKNVNFAVIALYSISIGSVEIIMAEDTDWRSPSATGDDVQQWDNPVLACFIGQNLKFYVKFC